MGKVVDNIIVMRQRIDVPLHGASGKDAEVRNASFMQWI
jgi:hypothetical protein